MTILPCNNAPGPEAFRPLAAAPPVAPTDAADGEIERVSREFEAVLTATMLKQGLSETSLRWDQETEDQSTDTFKAFAYEQIAYTVGQQGVLGITDQIREQLRSLR